MIYSYQNLGRNGRLGNQLWQIASTIGHAVKNNAEASFPDWQYRDYFSVPDVYFTNKQGDVDFGLDYLQDLKHFTPHCDSLIREYFKPSKMVDEIIQDKYGLLNNPYYKTAVHVRRGDYVNLPQHHPVCGVDFYEEGIYKAQGCFKSPKDVFVFSDDIEWCKQQEIFEGVNFIEGNNEAIDLHLMSRCQSHVISNSTFSWWGAWLYPSQSWATVFYPSNWYGPALQHIDVKGTMIPNTKSWKEIER